METHSCCAAKGAGYKHQRNATPDDMQGHGCHGKSAQSVGHRAKAALEGAAGALTQGQAASAIARGEMSIVVEAVFVSLGYAEAAVSVTPETAEVPTSPEGAETDGGVTAPVTLLPETPDTAEQEDPVADPPKEEAAAGYLASGYFVSAQATYVSASIALELLR